MDFFKHGENKKKFGESPEKFHGKIIRLTLSLILSQGEVIRHTKRQHQGQWCGIHFESQHRLVKSKKKSNVRVTCITRKRLFTQPPLLARKVITKLRDATAYAMIQGKSMVISDRF